jgi:hypothetical protein
MTDYIGIEGSDLWDDVCTDVIGYVPVHQFDLLVDEKYIDQNGQILGSYEDYLRLLETGVIPEQEVSQDGY